MCRITIIQTHGFFHLNLVSSRGTFSSLLDFNFESKHGTFGGMNYMVFVFPVHMNPSMARGENWGRNEKSG